MAKNILQKHWTGSAWEELHPITKATNVITNAAESVEEALGKKVDKVTGKGLSTEDFTTAEKSKLSGIAANANNYTHPATHPPGIIAQDTSNRFVTDAEKSAWNAKASTAQATASAAGLMSSTHYSKLEGIATGANNYVHPSGDGNQHVPATGTTNNAKVLKAGATAGSAAWGNVAFSEVTGKPTTLAGYGITDAASSAHIGSGGTAHAAATTSAAGFMSATDKSKLDGIAAGAQVNPGAATTTTAGLMSAADKSKLDGVAAGANNYVHPATHPPSIIAQDASNRFATDAEKAAWNAKASTAVVTTSANGLMSSTDKSKLDGIAAGAQVNPGAATTTTAGLMSAADKGKLDGVTTGAQVNRTQATQAQAIAGTDSATDMSPLRVREAIDARTRYGTTAGTATALTLTLSPAPASLYTGLQVTVKLHVAAGTNPTLNVNGLGAKALYDADGARFSGESGKIYSFVYDGTNFIQSSGGGGGKLNVYTGTTQPTKKEGVWINTATAITAIRTESEVWLAGSWSTSSYSGLPRASFSLSGTVQYSGYIYVAGGFDNTVNQPTNTLYRYSISTNSWTTLANMPAQMYGHSVNVTNGKIYIIGGTASSFNPMSSLFCYDISGNTWTTLASMPQDKTAHTSVVYNNKIYVLSGRNSSGSHSAVYCYDISANTWTELLNSSMFHSQGATSEVIGSTIYCLYANSVYLYDIAANSFTVRTLTTTLEHYISSVSVGSDIYVADAMKRYFRYNTLTNTLTALASVPSASTGYTFYLSFYNGTIFAMTGSQTYGYNLTSAVYPAGTVILQRISQSSGSWQTELVSPSKSLLGVNTRMLNHFDDVYIHDGTTLRGDLPSYYGNGSAWVKFKN